MIDLKNLFQNRTHALVGIGIAVLTVSGVGYYFYHQHKLASESSRQFRGIPVEVERVRVGTLSRKINVIGSLFANNAVTLRALVRGQIAKVNVRGGEEVQKGQVLFELDDRPFKAQLKDAQASWSFAQLEFKRAEQLKEKNFGTTKVLDKTRAEFQRAEASVEKAEKELEDTKITAPFEGLVSIHKISPGALVGPDVELMSLTDVDPMKVEFKIPAKYLPYINVGQRVTVTVDSFKDKAFEGEIENIDPLVDPGAQQVTVRANINNKDRLLKPGLFAKVTLVAGSKDNAVLVPSEAIESTGDLDYVYKVIEHPEQPGIYIAFRAALIAGIQDRDTTEVERGLSEGDLIVVVGREKLKDGMPVRFDPASVQSTPDPAEVGGNGPTAEPPKEQATEPKAPEAATEPTKLEPKTEEAAPAAEAKQAEVKPAEATPATESKPEDAQPAADKPAAADSEKTEKKDAPAAAETPAAQPAEEKPSEKTPEEAKAEAAPAQPEGKSE